VGGCAPLEEGELGPHLTQCGQGRGLPACHVLSWSVQPFVHSARTLQADRTEQRSDSIGRTVLQTVAQKLNKGAQLQAFPYLTASKSFLYSNAFMAKSGAQYLMFKSVTNRQTNRLNVFNRPGGGWNPSPTKLGMVIEDLELVLASLKLLGDLTHNFAAGERWKFGGKPTPST